MKKDDSFDRLLERAAHPHEDRGTTTGCLEAETLAAWTDGTLTRVDRAAAEAHAADCGRCLAMLAAMVKTEPPAQVDAESRRTSWFSVRWLAPLATAAVAIVAWVILQNPAERTREISPTPMPPIDALSPAPPPPAERDAAGQTRAGAEEGKRMEAPVANSRRQSPADAPRRDETREKRETQERLARDGLLPLEKTLPQGRGASAPTAKALPPAATPAPAPPSISAGERVLLFQAARTPAVITSPDPNVRWRFAGSIVERSTDGGVTWIVQATGSKAILAAGVSPAGNVCWIVGQAGTVLLTTDGATWSRLDFPDPQANLAGVAARDALSATVTTLDGRAYRTEDGGKTWRVQESSAAAF